MLRSALAPRVLQYAGRALAYLLSPYGLPAVLQPWPVLHQGRRVVRPPGPSDYESEEYLKMFVIPSNSVSQTVGIGE